MARKRSPARSKRTGRFVRSTRSKSRGKARSGSRRKARKSSSSRTNSSRTKTIHCGGVSVTVELARKSRTRRSRY